MIETVLVLGTGQAGFQLAASLREAGFSGRVVLIGDEPGLPYQRPPLSKAYLTGKMDDLGVQLRQQGFFDTRTIDIRAPERAVAIDRARQRVALASGEDLPYDHLVIATGARNRALDVPGAGRDGVFYLRTLAEARLLRERMRQARHVAVVGAGFIGLEFAAVAGLLGANVHIIEAADRVMGRAVSKDLSHFFAEEHLAWGAEILFGTTLMRILGEAGTVGSVETTTGDCVPADLVLIGIGVVPNVELAAAAGLATDNGIRVDAQLLTSDPAISAIGDCVSCAGRFCAGLVRLESVQNAVDQGKCVAARLAGQPAPYDAVPWFWSDQRDLKLQIVGLTTGHDRTVIRGDPAERRFSVFCFRDGRLAGIESVNRPSDHVMGRRLFAGSVDLTADEVADPAFDLKAYVSAAQPRIVSTRR